MTMGVAVGKLATVVDKLPNVVHVVVARPGHSARHDGCGGSARGHGQVRLFAVPANPPEQWVWENVEAEYVNEINESDCFPFAEIERLRIRMQDNANMLDCLELYLTEQILEHIVNETNRFANDFITQYPDKTKNTYIGKWTDVTTPELKKFIGSVILMRIIHKPSLPDYWSLDDVYCTPIFSRSMIRDRFFLILKFLHFNNNNDPPYDANDKNRDRLHKLRPFLEMARD